MPSIFTTKTAHIYWEVSTISNVLSPVPTKLGHYPRVIVSQIRAAYGILAAVLHSANKSAKHCFHSYPFGDFFATRNKITHTHNRNGGHLAVGFLLRNKAPVHPAHGAHYQRRTEYHSCSNQPADYHTDVNGSGALYPSRNYLRPAGTEESGGHWCYLFCHRLCPQRDHHRLPATTGI